MFTPVNSPEQATHSVDVMHWRGCGRRWPAIHGFDQQPTELAVLASLFNLLIRAHFPLTVKVGSFALRVLSVVFDHEAFEGEL